MENNKSNVFLIILLCAILILASVLLIKVIKTNTHNNDITSETTDSFISETDDSAAIPPVIDDTTDNITVNDDKNDDDMVEDNKEPDTIVTDNSNGIGVDNSTGGLSVFDVPFADGYEFPDLSDYDIVFIGDSIFDMNGSETSIPRQLEVYTNARVYNLSKNTSCAGIKTNGYISFPELADSFVAGTQTNYSDTYTFNSEILRFNEDDHNKRPLIIVMNICINDYLFSTKISNPNDSMDKETYEGALRYSISQIKKAYPKAYYIYMEPYIIGTKLNGEELNSYGYILSDYITTLEKVSVEQGVMCFDLRSYDAFKEYREGPLLGDLIHPNNMGSKTITRLFCDFVSNHIK